MEEQKKEELNQEPEASFEVDNSKVDQFMTEGNQEEQALEEQGTWICANCGQQNLSESVFCTKCGKNQNGEEAGEEAQKDGKPKKSKKWLVILFVIIVLGMLSAAYNNRLLEKNAIDV
jgi:membrane protease subunit (stomatin/prohibitin family)